MKEEYTFWQGVRDGLPIAAGYVAVSFGFGVLVSSASLPVWLAVLISMTNLTSAGQLAGLGVILSAGGYLEIILTQLVINVRYALMSLTLSQRVDASMTLSHRLVCAVGITDEVFGVAAAKEGSIGKRYLYGLMLPAYLGWALGTLLGAVLGNVLPASLCTALGIALYAMFIAIILPPAQTDRGVCFAVLGAILVSSILYFVPVFSQIPSGFTVILASVPVAALVAWRFPIATEEVL